MGEGLLQYLPEKEKSIRETRKEPHAIPEPGFQEERTSAYLAERLRHGASGRLTAGSKDDRPMGHGRLSGGQWK